MMIDTLLNSTRYTVKEMREYHKNEKNVFPCVSYCEEVDTYYYYSPDNPERYSTGKFTPIKRGDEADYYFQLLGIDREYFCTKYLKQGVK